MKKGQQAIAGFKDGMGPQAKEYRSPLDAEKDKKTGFPPEPPEGAQIYRLLDFTPVRPISDFSSLEL